MKTILIGLFLIFTTFLFGQATLEHTYTTSSENFGERYSFAFNTETGLHHFTYDSLTNTFKIYNESHTLINTFIAQIPNNYQIYIDGFSFGGVLATDKLFNSNSNIEFLISLVNPTTWDYKFILINDSGVVLQQFNDRGKFGGIFKTNSGIYKMILKKVVTNSSLVDVYTLPGTLSINQQLLLGTQFKSYPNPTDTTITISNQLLAGENSILELFDINGQLLKQQPVSGHQGDITMDVSDLSSGVYVLKLKGETHKFIKK